MGRFAKLLQGKGKEVKIGDETFTVKPLGAKNLGLFAKTDAKDPKAMMEFVLVSLQQSDSSITREDVEEIPLGDFQNIVEVILEVNELDKKR